MTSLHVDLPMPPSANALFKNVRQGGRAKTAAYKAWLEAAGYQITTAWRALGRPTFAPPLQLVISLGLRGRRRDAGNCLKPIEDALVKSIDGLPDDRHNDLIIVERCEKVPEGIARVTIRELPNTS